LLLSFVRQGLVAIAAATASSYASF
jgi:hypothetical protein